jgi:hypothetical protein
LAEQRRQIHVFLSFCGDHFCIYPRLGGCPEMWIVVDPVSSTATLSPVDRFESSCDIHYSLHSVVLAPRFCYNAKSSESSRLQGLSICKTAQESLFILRRPRHENQICDPAFFEIIFEFGWVKIQRKHGPAIEVPGLAAPG